MTTGISSSTSATLNRISDLDNGWMDNWNEQTLYTSHNHFHMIATFAPEMSIAMSVFLSTHHFGLDCTIQTMTGWISIKFCTEIHGLQKMNHAGFGGPQYLAPQYVWHFWFWVKCLNSNWIVHGPLRINCNSCRDPFSFSLAPPADQFFSSFKFFSSNILVYDQIPEKLLTLYLYLLVFGMLTW